MCSIVPQAIRSHSAAIEGLDDSFYVVHGSNQNHGYRWFLTSACGFEGMEVRPEHGRTYSRLKADPGCWRCKKSVRSLMSESMYSGTTVSMCDQVARDGEV